tara:strand:- start:2486 stop:3934 length:1449 start_codon:yes stop_codon:yes gene_type:complete
MEALKNNMLTGFFWTGIDVLVNRGIYVFLQLVLARILFPEDYGIVAMAAVFITLLELINDLGLGSALIQKRNEELSGIHYDTAFWTGVVWAAFLYTIIYFVATPFISKFYGEEILNNVIPCMALTLLFSSVAGIHRAKLIKRLQFKKITLVNTVSTVIAGVVSLFLAYKGFGIWALALYSVVKLCIAVPLLFAATRWSPSFQWSFEAFRLLFGFGVFTLGTAIANVFSQKIDYLVIGKLIGATVLGYYTFAFLLTNVVRQQIVGILGKVLFPVYAQLQDQPKKLFSLYLKMLSVNALIVYPVLLGIFMFSEYMLPLLFDAKWNQSIPLLKILSVSVLIQMTVNSNQLLFRSYGKVRLEFTLQLVKAFLFFIPLIYVGTSTYGVLGAAGGFVLATFLSAVLTLYFLKQIFNMKLNHLVEALKIPVAMLLVCFSSTWLVLYFAGWQVGLAFYGSSVLVFYGIFAKKQTRFIVSVIQNRIRKNTH